MSGRTYNVSFRSAKEERRIRKEMERMIKKELERVEQRGKILSKLEWIRESSEEISLPDDCAEVRIPDQWTSDVGISNESLFTSSGMVGINLTIFDQSLPDEKCDEIASKFSREMYRKVTGKEASKDSISIQPIARLKHPICQHCFRPVSDFIHKCPACGRGFCYSHRRPGSHGCSVDIKPAKEESIKEFVRKGRISAGRNRQPKIIIRKIPCG